jgi:hypothetical protein
MTIAYTWKITQTDYQTSNGFIQVGHWTATAVDGEHTASIYSTASWQEGAPTIPYASVTEEEVLNWVWESVDKDAVEASLAAQIEAKKNPVQATGVPW